MMAVAKMQKKMKVCYSFKSENVSGGGGGGGRVVRWCWVNFQCRGVLLIWIKVGQGPTVLAVGAGWVVWTFFL